MRPCLSATTSECFPGPWDYQSDFSLPLSSRRPPALKDNTKDFADKGRAQVPDEAMAAPKVANINIMMDGEEDQVCMFGGMRKYLVALDMYIACVLFHSSAHVEIRVLGNGVRSLGPIRSRAADVWPAKSGVGTSE